ncbi:MAG: hypothetical protein J5529_04865 [Prevotella sp.]|nr:hypothetical protein [Prevotella sp.]
MKTNNIIAIILMVAAYSINANAQIRNKHLFFHIDFAAGNVYTASYPSFLTYGLNELTHSNIFESALEYSVFNGDLGNDKINMRNYNITGFTANELFQNLHPSLKIGYQSSSLSDFNYGAYATAEYQHNHFKSRFEGSDIHHKNTLNRALFGGSLFAVIGNMEKPFRLMFEGGIRYSMCLGYKGPLAIGKEDIDNGISSHWAIKVSTAKGLQDFGVYFDINHFDLLKSENGKLNNWSAGLIWAVTPGQRENRQNVYY